jgi:hypothetical protein
MQDLPKIGLDLDGVLIDHSSNKRRLASRFGYELECWQSNTNVIRQFLPRDVYRRIQDEIYAALTVEAPIMPGALEAIKSIRADFYLVSARRPDSIRFVQRWLCDNRVYDIIPAERIFFCGTGEDKGTHCERLGFDCFIDDNLAVLNYLPRNLDLVLFDADAVGSRLNTGDWVTAVSGWPEFQRLMCESPDRSDAGNRHV